MFRALVENMPPLLGACFYLYWPASWFLVDAAHKEYRNSPGGLFSTSCFYNVLSMGALSLLLCLGVFDRSRDWNLLSWLVVWFGCVGWAFVAMYLWVQTQGPDASPARASPRKLQCWMNDLLAAAFFFGVAMIPSSVLLGETYFSDFTEAIIWSAAYLLVSVLLGLLVALDLFREMTEPPKPKIRMAIILAVIGYAALSLLLGCFFAWLTWKRAVRRADSPRH